MTSPLPASKKYWAPLGDGCDRGFGGSAGDFAGTPSGDPVQGRTGPGPQNIGPPLHRSGGPRPPCGPKVAGHCRSGRLLRRRRGADKRGQMRTSISCRGVRSSHEWPPSARDSRRQNWVEKVGHVPVAACAARRSALSHPVSSTAMLVTPGVSWAVMAPLTGDCECAVVLRPPRRPRRLRRKLGVLAANSPSMTGNH